MTNTSNEPSNPYRLLPAIDKLLTSAQLRRLIEVEGLPRDFITTIARERLELARQNIRQGATPLTSQQLLDEIESVAKNISNGNLREVINATGVIVHTNIGRAPLSVEAAMAVSKVAVGYSNLEYELDTGERGSRMSHISDLIARLTGAEAGLAVNNNAAAVFMVLSAFARDKEALISRGQAVEIGGSFRVPDVIAQSGGRLVDVGTTNKTYLRDYENAITPNTAVILQVHSSNFKVIGFTHSAKLEELVQLANAHNLIVVEDLGSGTLLDTAQYGLSHEPTVQESISKGVHLVTFSGDKLLGGPQAGIIAGRKDLVEKLKNHTLARALRLDKMTIAALQTTFLHYLKGEAERKIPVWQMISMSQTEILQRAKNWQAILANCWEGATIVEGLSTVGGGSLPGETLPTYLLALPALQGKNAAMLTSALRQQHPAIICRVERETLLLDPRTVLPNQDEILLGSLKKKGSITS
ncbi:L-seryl-tRNA(Sec) selenium transferase [Candidatus Chlorohelix sp.]|uniref:L-seryl-tRNA(Sec) selenium transferase n=1 Tax=Candidatus Chlorohelix sp. TaxID=3139201 RepID=UPI003069D984